MPRWRDKTIVVMPKRILKNQWALVALFLPDVVKRRIPGLFKRGDMTADGWILNRLLGVTPRLIQRLITVVRPQAPEGQTTNVERKKGNELTLLPTNRRAEFQDQKDKGKTRRREGRRNR